MFLDETFKYSYKQAGNLLWRILRISKHMHMIIVSILDFKNKRIKVLCAPSCKSSCPKFDFLWVEYGHMF